MRLRLFIETKPQAQYDYFLSSRPTINGLSPGSVTLTHLQGLFKLAPAVLLLSVSVTTSMIAITFPSIHIF